MSQTMSPPMPDAAPPMDAPPAAPESNVVVTITSPGDGTFMVFPGDEPDEAGPDMSADDAGIMGDAAPAAAPPAAEGKPAGSVGEALKIAMDFLSAADTSGAPSAEDNFAGGFGAPPPAGGGALGQKY